MYSSSRVSSLVFCFFFVSLRYLLLFFFFFFNDTATTEIYPLSLHDALPIFLIRFGGLLKVSLLIGAGLGLGAAHQCIRQVPKHHVLVGIDEPRQDQVRRRSARSEEHTSELQSLTNLVCRLLLEKKKKQNITTFIGQGRMADSARKKRR